MDSAPADGNPPASGETYRDDLPWLKWHDSKPIAHTFRYGAESVEVPADGGRGPGETATTTSVSSFAAMDVLLEALCDRTNYPSLERIVVAGHSAGGQFVHRYGISSGSPCLDDGDRVKLVAANPRSFAYLDGRRYLPKGDVQVDAGAASDGDAEERLDVRDGGQETLSPFDELEYRLPDADELGDCEGYNMYEWGLDANPDVPAPYVAYNLARLLAEIGRRQPHGSGGDDEAFCRYALRDVVYLSGERDVKRLGNQICDEDGYQGPSRRERSERFFAGLQARGREVAERSGGDGGAEGDGGHCGRMAKVMAGNGGAVHRRSVVRNVGHDHALIFQSEVGRRELGV